MPNTPDVLVFDFDGVILDSADIKTNAFRQLFSGYPDKLAAIISYHETNAGISRFQKFRYIYQYLLNKSLSPEEERELCAQFTSLVVEEVMQCSFVPGALEFLRTYRETHLLFVASGTPEDELHRLVFARGLAYLFRGVYGSPKTKTVILEEILTMTRIPRTSLFFIGDGFSDYEAAKATGVTFIGRVKPGRPHPFKGLGVSVVADLFELERRLGTKASGLNR